MENSKTTWRKVKLEEATELIIDHRGKTPKKLGGNWSVQGIPAISAKNIKEGKIVNESDIRYVSKELYEKWMPEKLESGDILLTSEAPLGELLYLKKKVGYCLSQRLFALRADKQKLNSSFLYYYLLSPRGRHELMRRISGTAAEGIRQAELRQIEIEFPEDINEQKLIASILSAFDDKIELNNKISQTLEQMAQAIFKEWFSAKDGKVPKEWRVGKLGELMVPRKEKFKKYEEWRNLKLLDLGRFPQKSLAITRYGKGEEIKTAGIGFRKGDVLFGAVRPYFHKVVIAPFNGVTNSSVFVITPKKESYYAFLVTVLFSENTINYASMSASGTKMPVLKWEDLNNMEILIPEEKVMNKFNKIVKNFYDIIVKNVEENKKLASLRDLLLPKLMSGKIKV